ncbi:MAG: sigma-54-dependent Fis family transcriptional regulator [Bradyrhizobium sp.]|nr:sigma-54-dependent Fis family transcriptional regulator [Bradyrhizobium sp.]
MPHALIVDDEQGTREVLQAIVVSEGFSVAAAADLRGARIEILKHVPDIVLTDLRLPDGNGMDLFGNLDPEAGVRVVVLTGFATVDSAVDALRLGATDYLIKPVNLERLKSLLERIPRNSDLRAEIGALRGELRHLGVFGRMFGNSPVMQHLYDQVARVAVTDATVLLIGESGTGKEVAAQTVHDLSPRRKNAFLAVNCGAISPNLIESEMFGHERGSFTGAERQHKGFFERASGGTLFLDEITEMPVELQVKLLRVLETGAFMRVGTTQQIMTDVRVIAATNRNPDEAVEAGKLRADLYHRLNVFPLRLPPLRERGSDIDQLANAFLEKLNETHNENKAFTSETLRAMRGHTWPGNVRELKNFVHRAFILADSGQLNASAMPMQVSPGEAPAPSFVLVPVGSSLAAADRQLILATLQHCGNIKRQAATMLGISLKTLYNRLEEYGESPLEEGTGEGKSPA